MNNLTFYTVLSLPFLALVACEKETAAPQGEAKAEAGSEDPKPYPLDVCLVSGEKLGSMGEPVSVVHEGQEILFCCEHCLPEFEEDPDALMSKLEE